MIPPTFLSKPPSLPSTGSTTQIPNHDVIREQVGIEEQTGGIRMVPERSATMPRQVTPPFLEPNTLSSKSVDDSFRAQLSMVNRRLYEFHSEFHKSWAEVKESNLGGSPFTQEIQDNLVTLNFRLSALETYDSSSDPTKHVIAFRAQMAFYGTSDTLMCRAFPITFKGSAWTWFSQLQPTLVSSFE